MTKKKEEVKKEEPVKNEKLEKAIKKATKKKEEPIDDLPPELEDDEVIEETIPEEEIHPPDPEPMPEEEAPTEKQKKGAKKSKEEPKEKEWEGVKCHLLIEVKKINEIIKIFKFVVNKSNTLPVLDNIQFTVNKDGYCQLYATNLELSARGGFTTEYKEKEDCSFLINYNDLVKIISSATNDFITFEADGMTMTITEGFTSFNLSIGTDPREFPMMPETEEGSVISIDYSFFKSFLEESKTFRDTNELRLVLNTVNVECNGTKVALACTDAHKLRYRSEKAQGDNFNINIPAAFCDLFTKIPCDNDEITIHVDKEQRYAWFETEKFFVTGILINGKYPNVMAVIPKEASLVIGLDRKLLTNELKRIDGFSNTATHQVKIEVTDDEITLVTKDLDFSKGAKSKIKVGIIGEMAEGKKVIGFNIKFLLSIITLMSEEKVFFHLSAPNRAAMITDFGKLSEDNIRLLMPVMIY
jgi:DNA polymerase III subunit beta